MPAGGEIREHMQVLGADGAPVGRVDGLEAGRIKLLREDDPLGHGAHRFIPLSAIAMVEGDVVRLNVPAGQARAMAAGGQAPEWQEEGFGAGRGLAQGVGDSAGAAANGPGSGNIRGGGTTAGRTGLAGGAAHGGGTGGGGTTGGHLGSGSGFRGDPNMDPSGRGEV